MTLSRPGANRWSIQEVAEHAILVAALIGSGVEQALGQAPDTELQEPAGAFDAMLSRVLDRSLRRVDAPPVTPQGQWTVAETVERFREVRGRARTLLQQPDLPLKGRVFAAMPGTFNCHHWLVLISLHTRRHLAQIAEVKLTQKSDGFPV